MSNQIRAWREYRGLTQEQLAEAANTSPQQVSRLETGARRLSDVWIGLLTAALSCTPTQLLNEPPGSVIQSEGANTDESDDSMPVEQLLVRVVRDLNKQQERQLQVLEKQNDSLDRLNGVLERLEHLLTLPERVKASR